jgi:hypothetical protein
VSFSINSFLPETFFANINEPMVTGSKGQGTVIVAYRSFLNKTKILTAGSGLLRQLLIFYLKLFKSSLKKATKRAVQILKLASFKKIQKPCRYNFLATFFQIILLFFKKKLKFSLILKFLNKNLKKSKPGIKKKALKKKVFSSLRRYNRKKFFKEGLNLVNLLPSQKESSKTLSSFIAKSLNNFKRHKFFLTYIKKSISVFAKKKRGAVKKLTIQLKGRINGRDRARSYTIEMKKQAALISIGSRINYSESTTFTPDGTLSVKVWLEYRKIKLYKLRRKKSKILRLIKLHKLRLKVRKLKSRKMQELLRRKGSRRVLKFKLQGRIQPKSRKVQKLLRKIKLKSLKFGKMRRSTHKLESEKLCERRHKKLSIKKRKKANWSNLSLNQTP